MTKIALFTNQSADGETPIFSTTFPDSKDFTRVKSSINIRGNIGGGTLSLQLKDIGGTFRELEADSTEINDNLASDNAKMSMFTFEYPSEEELKIVLSGSTSPALYIEATNCKL